jgi:hypothetical protein
MLKRSPENFHPFGSTEWVNQMFSDPPARVVKGRKKWTHRHAPWVDHLGRLAFVESRNELIGLLALQYLRNINAVRRYKEQAFKTDEKIFGQEYTPDFAFETINRRIFVVEVKTARFVTRIMEVAFENLKTRFSDFNLNFLVWTDQAPLIHPLRHNLLLLRRAAAEFIEPDETARLMDMLCQKGPMQIWALCNQGLDITLIAHAAWHGRVSMPLLSAIDGSTTISLHPTMDLETILLGTQPNIRAWWDSLEDAA